MDLYKENALAMYIFAYFVINYDSFSWCCKESQGLYHPTHKKWKNVDLLALTSL